MYDGLTGRYTFSCPARGEVKVRLSEPSEVDDLLDREAYEGSLT